jgi:predicted metal-dependent hydrolase
VAAQSALLEPPFPLPVPLEFRRSPRARRISLKIDNARGRVVLTAPMRAATRQALDFLARSEGWLRQRLAELPTACPFVDGATVPLLGVPCRLRHDGSRLRGVTARAGEDIVVPGAAEHLARRVTDFLKAEARREIGDRARAKAAVLGRPIKAITLRDTRTRWGSCSRKGGLTFSWRLILAPEFVLDYVVAHEVAHLQEMNHGPGFWALCKSLTAADAKAARAWLKGNGGALHAYG